MKKITLLFCLLGLIAVLPVIADEEAVVAERTTCADIKSQIDELGGIIDPDEDVLDEIAQLKNDYRRNCSKTAARRRTSAKRGVVDAPVVIEENFVEEDVSEEPSETIVLEQDFVEVAETDISESEPKLSDEEILEQELANLDAGLCADGTKPNKFGCCTDEIFKDMGNAVFACCPKDGGKDMECFPPIGQI
ncbi:MAG: hypothetical protein IKW67_00400 [Alphaproteobacteria bacterium]|nr:hypothetical protein [Alphaproteobacteria bacterium]